MEDGQVRLDIDMVFKSHPSEIQSSQNEQTESTISSREGGARADSDALSALKFTERIEREVLIVAAIIDSDNYRINHVQSPYTK